jgi:hypothetical protein
MTEPVDKRMWFRLGCSGLPETPCKPEVTPHWRLLTYAGSMWQPSTLRSQNVLLLDWRVIARHGQGYIGKRKTWPTVEAMRRDVLAYRLDLRAARYEVQGLRVWVYQVHGEACRHYAVTGLWVPPTMVHKALWWLAGPVEWLRPLRHLPLRCAWNEDTMPPPPPPPTWPTPRFRPWLAYDAKTGWVHPRYLPRPPAAA